MRSFEAFSDHDFEFFVADLLGELDGVRYEVFSRGADRGVDLRYSASPLIAPDVVQCKRYIRSTYSHLRAATEREVEILKQTVVSFRTYRLVTTLELTAANKDELASILSDYVEGPRDIIAAGDLEIMLNANEHVERRHPKLWLGGGIHLETLINNGTYQRSRQVLEETRSMLERYVETKAFATARGQLWNNRVLIIAGSPGIGKTTLARMLLADAAIEGYELIAISGDTEEAYDVLRPGALQVFYYDDFLGTTFLQMPLIKNEDKRIAQLIRRVANSDTSLFVMTTREHILQQALETSELLTREGIDARRYLLELGEYTPLDRARIFYNHIWSSGQLDQDACWSLVAGRAYQRILDHKNYNPRLIEHITGLGSHDLCDADLEDYLDFALRILDDPSQIWHHAFEHQLDDAQRALLIVLASMQSQVVLEDLEAAFRAYCQGAGIELHTRLFKRTLKILDDSFISITRERDETLVKPANPSIVDFIALWLRQSPEDVRRALAGALFFPQLEWIERSVLSRLEHTQDFLLEAFDEALRRLVDSPETRWQMVRESGRVPRLGRIRLDTALRLVVVARICEAHADLRPSLTKWLEAQVEREGASWAGEGKYDAHVPSAISLLAATADLGVSTQELRARLKALVDQRLEIAEDWDQLLRLRALEPDLYDPEEWRELQSRFSQFAEEAVACGTNYFHDVDEVSQLRRLAREMRVRFGRWELARLRREVADEEEREESGVEIEAPELTTQSIETGLHLDESAQIQALFDHLVQADSVERTGAHT